MSVLTQNKLEINLSFAIIVKSILLNFTATFSILYKDKTIEMPQFI